MIVHEIVSKVIDKKSLFEERRKKGLRDKIGKLGRDVEKDFLRQNEIERFVAQRLDEIDTDRKFRQFLNPSLYSDYKSSTNPVEVLYWFAYEASRQRSELDGKQKLALRLIEKDKAKIVKSLEWAISELKKLGLICEEAPVPTLPLRKILTRKYNYDLLLKFFKRQ